MALPGSVVIGGITMVVIAFRHADTLVVDDYYRDGLAINQTLEKDQRAAALNLRAELTFDFPRHELRLRLTGDLSPLPALQLQLLHPTDNTRDDRVLLTGIGGANYAGELTTSFQHRYYLRLQPASLQGEPATDAAWRLNGELDFNSGHQTVLIADE